MAKLTENAFRDVNIAFANKLSLISDKIGIDVWELFRLANQHPRVNILEPGCGVGGHCIAVDPWFIVDKTPVQARLIVPPAKSTIASWNGCVDESLQRPTQLSLVASRNRMSTWPCSAWRLHWTSTTCAKARPCISLRRSRAQRALD